MFQSVRFTASKLLTASRFYSQMNFNTLEVTNPSEFVHKITLNRPKKLNAMNSDFWRELPECVDQLNANSDCRVIIIAANGPGFTAGLDLAEVAPKLFQASTMDASRRAFALKKIIRDFQYTFTSLEKCSKPIIAAVHGFCIGGGVDLILAADMRYATIDAFFQIKEVDLGLAADVGTPQRLPKVIGNEGLAREWCYTARRISADEALRVGMLNGVCVDQAALMNRVMNLAETIAQKSPIAVQCTKATLVYSRDHPVDDSLEHIALINQCMLQSEDLVTSAQAMMTKEKPVYPKL